MENLNQIIRDIRAHASIEDIRAIEDAIRVRFDIINRSASYEFRIGDTVRFNSKTRGIITGKISKINRKTIKVTTDSGMIWKVSPTLLEKV